MRLPRADHTLSEPRVNAFAITRARESGIPVVTSPTILLCDDAEGFRLMLGGFLSDAGLAVSYASTWDDAVTGASERQPDAILVDLWMPTYDLALLRGLRACSPRSAVVVVSALSIEQSTLAVAGIDGIAAVVSKRDRPEAIVAAVTDALHDRESGPVSVSVRTRAEEPLGGPGAIGWRRTG
jgi:DNA-binding response OmpR family regulator